MVVIIHFEFPENSLNTNQLLFSEINYHLKADFGITGSFINVEFSGAPLLVEISRVSGTPITKAKVRPEGKTKPATVRNGKVYLTVTIR